MESSEHIYFFNAPFSGDATSLSKSFNLSTAMKNYIVGLHNDFRSSVANGQTGSQPSGADLQKMVKKFFQYWTQWKNYLRNFKTWDPTLAAYAQSNTDKCNFVHSATKISGYSGTIGENMAAGQLLAPINTDADLQAAFNVQFQPSEFPGIDTWTDEHTHYNYPECEYGQTCGHYTQVKTFFNTNFSNSVTYYELVQLVWASSNKVGCGISQCNGLDGGFPNPEDQLTNLILCNYSPA